MIAEDHKQRVFVIIRLFGHAEKFRQKVVGKFQGVKLRHADKTAFLGLGLGNGRIRHKAGIVFGNGIGAVVAGRLNNGKERLAGFLLVGFQNTVGFAEQIQVRNTPYVVAVFMFKVAFFVHMHVA